MRYLGRGLSALLRVWLHDGLRLLAQIEMEGWEVVIARLIHHAWQPPLRLSRKYVITSKQPCHQEECQT
jgi:hypothetical protein